MNPNLDAAMQIIFKLTQVWVRACLDMAFRTTSTWGEHELLARFVLDGDEALIPEARDHAEELQRKARTALDIDLSMAVLHLLIMYGPYQPDRETPMGPEFTRWTNPREFVDFHSREALMWSRGSSTPGQVEAQEWARQALRALFLGQEAPPAPSGVPDPDVRLEWFRNELKRIEALKT